MPNLEKLEKQFINKADAEIMDWIYEIIKVNFDADFIQDSTELRDILKDNFRGKFEELENEYLNKLQDLSNQKYEGAKQQEQAKFKKMLEEIDLSRYLDGIFLEKQAEKFGVPISVIATGTFQMEIDKLIKNLD